MARTINSAEKLKISELGRAFSDTTIKMHQAIAKKAGLSGTDHKYLGLLIENGAMTAGELARITSLTTGAVTGLIDRLEKKKFVKRKFDRDDRRKVMIVPDYTVTSKVLGSIFAGLQSLITDHISTLSEGELLIIETYLQSTISIMKNFTLDLEK